MTPFVPPGRLPACAPPPTDVPTPALDVLAGLGVSPVELAPAGFAGPRRPVHRLVGAGLVLELAAGEAGRLRLRREVWGRQWAQRVGISTVPVLGADSAGGWLISEWWHPSPPAGDAFLADAVATAVGIAAAAPPPAGPPRNVWTSPRRSAPIRLARGLLGGVPTRLWLAARRAASELPTVPVAHGDYYHRNALWCPDRGGVHVVDWEYLGPGRRHGDLLRLWTLLPDRNDRDALWTRIVGLAPVEQHREIGALALYLALRLLGENVKGAGRDRHPADLAHAHAIQPEARTLARDLGAWPL